MALPPERIRIKRQRQEDPVDTLYLEQNDARRQKRRFTEFVFQRLRYDGNSSDDPKSISESKQKAAQRYVSDQARPGIPLVRATDPGTESKDILRIKAAHKSRLQGQAPGTSDAKDVVTQNQGTDAKEDSLDESQSHQPSGSVRRFRLARKFTNPLAPDQSGGIRKSATTTKLNLAVFVESFLKEGSPHPRKPIDRLVELESPSGKEQHSGIRDKTVEDKPAQVSVSKTKSIKNFLKPDSQPVKTGQSIRDPPSTWDLSSDQLADELAALAMEIDNENEGRSKSSEAEPPHNQHSETNTDPNNEDFTFIYETYIRVPQMHQERIPSTNAGVLDQNVGVLVIEDEDEELWESFIEKEDEIDWNEEDADSNAEDNPVNDYPDDEMSSDDEYDHESHRYREDYSDSDEYDQARGI